MSVIATDIEQLLARYQLILLDAYGVLLDQQGPLPGARELIARLNSEQRPYFILSNSASRLPEMFAAEFQRLGMEVAPSHIITSGELLVSYFSNNHLCGARCAVLGPENSAEYVRRAGGVVVAVHEEAEVVVVADQAGFPLLEGLNGVVSRLLQRLDRGDSVKLVLCNPDLIYPLGKEQYGITAGSLALLIEGILRERYGDMAPEFISLGKPHTPLFTAALGDMPTECAVMIGDQLGTDILGARRSGIDSALVMSGLARDGHQAGLHPTYRLTNLLMPRTER